MTRKNAWTPLEGPGSAPQQQVPARIGVHGDGHADREDGGLWSPSEGPVRADPGGPGGEPDGHTVIRPVTEP
jgi:hypothetical protein